MQQRLRDILKGRRIIDSIPAPTRGPMRARHRARAAVYRAQCATFAIAREITGDDREITHGDEARRPPFTLRIVRTERDAAAQAFRDLVAAETRRRRAA